MDHKHGKVHVKLGDGFQTQLGHLRKREIVLVNRKFDSNFRLDGLHQLLDNIEFVGVIAVKKTKLPFAWFIHCLLIPFGLKTVPGQFRFTSQTTRTFDLFFFPEDNTLELLP